jgi:hypothetical protein
MIQYRVASTAAVQPEFSIADRWNCAYRRAIVPIGVMFSLSLICGNLAYLYLSVSFIQMLKVRLNREFSPQLRFALSQVLDSTQC